MSLPVPAQALGALGLVLLLIAANSAPVLVARVMGGRLAQPVDANRLMWDRRPIFGSHKTWRGLVAGIVAAAAAAALLGLPVLVGTAFGALTLLGDLCSSCIKRRLDLRSGQWIPFLDQLPEALIPLVILRDMLGITWAQVALTTAAFTLLDLIASRMSERFQGRSIGAGTP